MSSILTSMEVLPNNMAWGLQYSGLRATRSKEGDESFTDKELYQLEVIWHVTAESFIGFDTVTTERPTTWTSTIGHGMDNALESS